MPHPGVKEKPSAEELRAMERGMTVAQITSEVEYHLGMVEAAQKAAERQAQAAKVMFDETGPTVHKFQEAADATMTAFAESQAERKASNAEKQRMVELLNMKAQAVWQRWVEAQDWETLWMDLRFWREVAQYTGSLSDVLRVSEDVEDACQELLRLLYKRTRRYDDGLQSEVHYPHKVRGLIERLTGDSE